jgi:hypothetical protein
MAATTDLVGCFVAKDGHVDIATIFLSENSEGTVFPYHAAVADKMVKFDALMVLIAMKSGSQSNSQSCMPLHQT